MKLVSLLDVCDIEGGTQPPKETFRYEPTEGYVRMLQIQDFKSDVKAVYIPVTSRMKTCEKDDVLIARYGASLGQIHTGKAGAYNVALVRTVPDAARLEKRYLYHVLRGNAFQTFLGCVGSRAAQAGFNKEDLARFQFHLPSLNEQRRIATILDQADALRAKRREAIAQLDELQKAIFVEMFGDPVANSKGWPTKMLKELGRVKTGGTPPSSKEGMFNGDVPFVTPGDLASNQPVKRTVTEEGAAEAETVRAGAALVCCIGATIGKMDKAEARCAFNQQINAVEWDAEINDDFGFGALCFFKANIAAWGASTTLPILKKSSFEKISIPVPPMPLQNEFARRVAMVGKIRDGADQSRIEQDSLFASLQHRAFQGAL